MLRYSLLSLAVLTSFTAPALAPRAEVAAETDAVRSIPIKAEIVGLGGKCLDVARGDTSNGTRIILWDCHGRQNQQWDVLNPNGTGAILGFGGDTIPFRCLDVAGGNTSNGTPIIYWECHGGANQRWRLRR